MNESRRRKPFMSKQATGATMLPPPQPHHKSSVELTKQIKKLTKPVCVTLVDIAQIIDFTKHPSATKILSKMALQHIENTEAKLLNKGSKTTSLTTHEQSLVEIEHFVTYRKNLNLQSPIAQVLRYDRANDSIANESFFDDEGSI